jgi:hypothetical protein
MLICAYCQNEVPKLTYRPRDMRGLCRDCDAPPPGLRSTTGTSFVAGAAAPPRGAQFTNKSY